MSNDAKCPVCGELIGTYRGKVNQHWLILPEGQTYRGRCTRKCKGSGRRVVSPAATS